MVYRVFATSLCTLTRTSFLPVQQLPIRGPLLDMASKPLVYSDPACIWLDAALERRTGPRSTSHWGYPGQSEPKSWMRISHRMGFVRAPIVVHGAVLGSAPTGAPLVTCTDCCAPKAGITPRISTNIKIRISLVYSPFILRDDLDFREAVSIGRTAAPGLGRLATATRWGTWCPASLRRRRTTLDAAPVDGRHRHAEFSYLSVFIGPIFPRFQKSGGGLHLGFPPTGRTGHIVLH